MLQYTDLFVVTVLHYAPNLTEMPVVGEHIAVQDWPIDESQLKDGGIMVKVCIFHVLSQEILLEWANLAFLLFPCRLSVALCCRLNDFYTDEN